MSTTISNPGFSAKDPTERIPIGFDFAADMAALGSSLAAAPPPVVTVARFNGADDAVPSAMLDGAPWIDGNTVRQWVVGGVEGCRYLWRCEAHSLNGAKVALAGTMLVRTK